MNDFRQQEENEQQRWDNDVYRKLRKPLPISEIEFRVVSINKGGYATIVPYKDARADQNRLDEVFGPLGWQRKHEFKSSFWFYYWIERERDGSCESRSLGDGQEKSCKE